MFKVGDIVEYEFANGEIYTGIITKIDNVRRQPYHVAYYKSDVEGEIDVEDWDRAERLKLVKRVDLESNAYDKFKAWMTKLAEIKGRGRDCVESAAFNALKRVTEDYTSDDHISSNGLNCLEEDIKMLWGYINDETYDVKEMTLEEIEAKLGYKIRIKE